MVSSTCTYVLLVLAVVTAAAADTNPGPSGLDLEGVDADVGQCAEVKASDGAVTKLTLTQDDIESKLAEARPTRSMPEGDDANESADDDGSVSHIPTTSRLQYCRKQPPLMQVAKDFESGSIYSGVVKMWRFHVPTQTFHHRCTGWKISSRLIATAAHCIYDTKNNNWFVTGNYRILITVGLNGRPSISCGGAICPDAYGGATYQDTEFGHFWVDNAWIYATYASLPSFSWQQGADIALMRTANPMPASLQSYYWANPVWMVDIARATPRRSIGYPAETYGGWHLTSDMAYKSLTYASSVYPGVDPAILLETQTVEGGNSGGPLFSSYKSRIVVGLCSAFVETGRCPVVYTGVGAGSTHPLAPLVSAAGYGVSNVGNIYWVS